MDPIIIGEATRIYALCEFPSMVPRYVGKTIRSLHLRMASHQQVANRKPRLPVTRWLAKAKREERQVCIKWLETVPAGEDWQARERFWIAMHRKDGASLLNLTDGGEGLAGHVFSAEHRAKIGAALRTGADCSCLNCGATFWRTRSEIRNGNAKYCSRTCYASDQIGKPKNVPSPVAAITAAAASKNAMTHCKRGHPLIGENLFKTSNGSRGCKECRKLHKAAYLARCK